MLQQDAVGCGGGIEMKCTGGCLKIHKTLYSCKMRDQSSPEAKTQKNELDTCLIILDPCLLKPVSIARHGSNYSENFKKRTNSSCLSI